jgi:hypothetical protein
MFGQELSGDFEVELGCLIEKWRPRVGTDAIIEGLDLYIEALEERRETEELRSVQRP